MNKTEEIIFQKDGFTVKLVRVDGRMFNIKISGKATLTIDESISLQYAINKFTGHL